MQPEEYLIKRDNILNTVIPAVNITADDNLLRQYSFVSANLRNYLPSIPVSDHKRIFKDILTHQCLSNLEQDYLAGLDKVTYENLTDETWDILKNKPSIICTFHTGSYRMLNLFLMKNKIPYSLIVAKKVVSSQGELFYEIYDQVSGGETDGFKIIDGESGSFGLQMIKELKKGKSILLYIDGNTGAGAQTTNNDNNVRIDFLEQELYARKGIGFLSHAVNVPIITAISYRKSLDDVRIKFLDPMYPDLQQNRDEFAMEATQKIYNALAEVIRCYPEQWESWLYLHKVIHINHPVDEQPILDHSCVSPDQYLLNEGKYGVFKIDTDAYLFDKSTYQSYEIDHDTFNTIKEGIKGPVNYNQEIQAGLYAQLLNNQILIPSMNA